MTRDVIINGETMLAVKSSAFALTNLGLAEAPVRISFEYKHEDINLDAHGRAPLDMQFMLEAAHVTANLIHFDPTVLRACMALAAASAGAILQGGTGVEGSFPRAGTRLGGGLPQFAAGNSLISLNLSSPVLVLPWRFFYTHLVEALEWPLGNERSVVNVHFRAIPYMVDPWNGGLGALSTQLYDHGTDS
jgi:hypothetical protein